jgi:hypothetical protein
MATFTEGVDLLHFLARKLILREKGGQLNMKVWKYFISKHLHHIRSWVTIHTIMAFGMTSSAMFIKKVARNSSYRLRSLPIQVIIIRTVIENIDGEVDYALIAIL